MNGRISEFYVHFTNHKRIKEKVENLYILDHYIRTHNIRKIVFWIQNIYNHPHYPYKGRTISLYRTKEGFQFVFYYWYNAQGYRVEYSKEHKHADFQCLMETLSTITMFQTSLIPYLIDPCL